MNIDPRTLVQVGRQPPHSVVQSPTAKRGEQLDITIDNQQLNSQRERLLRDYTRSKVNLHKALEQITMKTAYQLEKIKKPSQELVQSVQWLCQMVEILSESSVTSHRSVTSNYDKSWREMLNMLLFTPKIFQEIKLFLKKLEDENVDKELYGPIVEQILESRGRFINFKDNIYQIVYQAALFYSVKFIKSQQIQIQEQLLNPNMNATTPLNKLKQLKPTLQNKKLGLIKKKHEEQTTNTYQTPNFNKYEKVNNEQNLISPCQLNNNEDVTYEYPKTRLTSKDIVFESPDKQKLVQIDLSREPLTNPQVQNKLKQVKFKMYLTNNIPKMNQESRQNNQLNEQFKQSPFNDQSVIANSKKRQTSFVVDQKLVNGINKVPQIQSNKSTERMSNKERLFNSVTRLSKSIKNSSIQARVVTLWKNTRIQQKQPALSLNSSHANLNSLNDITVLQNNKNSQLNQSQQVLRMTDSFQIQPQIIQQSYQPSTQAQVNRIARQDMNESEEQRKRQKSLELQQKRDQLIQELSRTLLEEKLKNSKEQSQ